MNPSTSSLLTRQELKNHKSIEALGLIASEKLYVHGACVLYLNAQDIVEIAPLWEVQLDSLEEKNAINALQQRGYDDLMLVEALKSRDARHACNTRK